ncbi:MAG: serine protease [Polyangiaceae bacterium]
MTIGLLATPSARADDLAYSKLDEATVRVFSFKSVELARVRSKSGRSYTLGTPDAGHGSGVVVSKDGLILTARHVVEDARWVAVQLPGREHPAPARVVYTDEEHDTAFLSVAADTPQFLELPAQKPKLTVRETVYVVGYPLDASRTRPQSEQGIVSGVLPNGSLQLGIALNPGNSGGPVVDAKERFIGIAVARADPRAGAQGIGIAVPLEHILPAYVSVSKGSERERARTELGQQASREQARAELLTALLTADDANSAWQALGGKGEAAASSPSVDARVRALEGKAEDADALSLASAQEWNAAAVLESRHEPNAERLAAARKLAKAALAADAQIGKRSAFVQFVLAGKEPHSSSPHKRADSEAEPDGAGVDISDDAPSREEEDAARQRFLDSLETKKSLPAARIGITAAVQAPFQILGVGAGAKLRLGERLNLDLRYAFGWHVESAGYALSHYAQGLVGIALANWNAQTNARLVVDVERHAGLTVFHYVPAKIPSVHSLVAEAGVVSGKLNFVTPSALAQQVVLPLAGLRYTYFYYANSEYLAGATKGSVDLALHAIGPLLLGAPDNASAIGGPPINRNAIGFQAEVDWQPSRSSSQVDFGLGYLPHGEWVVFRLGWSYLFY